MKFLKAFGYFCYDFVIGDDWKIAAYVVALLALVAVAARLELAPDGLLTIGGAIALMVCFAIGVVADARRTR